MDRATVGRPTANRAQTCLPRSAILRRLLFVLVVSLAPVLTVSAQSGACSFTLGFATLHSTPVLHRPTGVGRITALAVHPSAQGQGIGRELLRAAEAHFHAQGLGRVEVTSGPSHAKAYPFYRRLGYEDGGVRFFKVI